MDPRNKSEDDSCGRVRPRPAVDGVLLCAFAAVTQQSQTQKLGRGHFLIRPMGKINLWKTLVSRLKLPVRTPFLPSSTEGLPMHYQYISLAGLLLDIVGFGFIVLDWHHTHDKAVRDKFEQLNERLSNHWRVQGMPELAASNDLFDIPPRMRFHGIKRSGRRQSAIFYVGAAMIFLGFVLQFVGTFASIVPGSVDVPFFGGLK